MHRNFFEKEFTYLNGFLRNVERYPDKDAIVDPFTKRKWTYRELDEESEKLAISLKKCGAKKHSVVMTALRNCPEFAFSYIGVRKTGAILLSANSNLASNELSLLIDHNKPKILIYSANIRDIIVEALEKSRHKVRKIILADNMENAVVPENHMPYEDFIAKGISEKVKTPRQNIYNEVLRLCTSGTSALPKSVPVLDINEVLSAHDVIMHYPLTKDDVTLNMTPWFHRGGCHSGGPCPSFYAGASVVVMRKFSPKTALEWVQKHSVTFMMGSPSNLELLCKFQGKMHYDLSNLKGIVTMGSPLAKSDCIRYIKTLTPNIFNGYGTTETFWNTFLTPKDLPEMAGTSGKSCTDDTVRVVKINENGFSSPDDTVAMDNSENGEVIIKSPAKSSCSYYKNKKEQKIKFHKGWMYTSDIAVWNKDGFITIKGRKDDMILVSGENIFPSQIEEALNNHPLVKDSIVTSVPDKIRGESLVAYIIPENETPTIEEIASFCSKEKEFSKYKRPRYFSFIDEIPRNAAGKKLHRMMREKALKDFEDGKLSKL